MRPETAKPWHPQKFHRRSSGALLHFTARSKSHALPKTARSGFWPAVPQGLRAAAKFLWTFNFIEIKSRIIFHRHTTSPMKIPITSMSRSQNLAQVAVASFSLALLVSGCSTNSPQTMKWSKSTPALEVLPQFTAADVPAFGPDEIPVDPPNWKVSPLDTNLPGNGLAQHPMLYIGEGCNKMFLVNDGKVIWTYSTGKGWEYDDIWLLSNGNILFSRMAYAAEVTPQKKIVWRLDAPKGTEIHTVQPIGLDKVLLVENGTPPRHVGDQQKNRSRRGGPRHSRCRSGRPWPIPPLPHDRQRHLSRPLPPNGQSGRVRQKLQRRSGPTKFPVPGRPSACTTATRSSPTNGTNSPAK